MKKLTKQEWLYVLKCIIGASTCYLLYIVFPQYPFFWSIISVVLVVSPENQKNLPYIRIEGNVLGSVVGLLVFFLPFPMLLLLCLGLSLTLIIGLLLKLTMSLRTAAAATVIVLFQETSAHRWDIALERVGCVMVGCAVGFIITLVFIQLEKIGANRKVAHNKKKERTNEY